MQFADNLIIINAHGVKTSDPRGNQYFQNIRQKNINTTKKYFNDAQKYWANVEINGKPVSLQEVAIQIAANNSIPYFTISGKEPAVGLSSDNRFIWYTPKFNIDKEPVDTGWFCAGGCQSWSLARESAAAMVAYSLCNDAVFRNEMKHLLQKSR